MPWPASWLVLAGRRTAWPRKTATRTKFFRQTPAGERTHGSQQRRAGPCAGAPEPKAELELLAQARTAMPLAAAETLAAVTEHQKRFPCGVFTQEREVLAVEALIRLGRREQASARFGRFGRDYPRSLHSARIRALLSEAP